MAETVHVLILDEQVLQGNESGDGARPAFSSSLPLLDVADEFGIKVNVMADPVRPRTWRAGAGLGGGSDRRADLWDESVRRIRARGHDVQLRLRPRRISAGLQVGRSEPAESWSLAALDRVTWRRLLADSIAYLHGVLQPLDPDYTVHVLQAGSWGTRPTDELLEDLTDAGIRVMVAAVPDFSGDHLGGEWALLRSSASGEDARGSAPHADPLVALPLPHYRMGPVGLSRRMLRALRAQAAGERGFYATMPVSGARGVPPGRPRPTLGEVVAQRGNLKPLDVGAAGSDELRFAVDQVLARCFRSETESVPLVLRSRTRVDGGNRDRLAQLIRHMVERYGARLQFQTFSEFRESLPRLTRRGQSPIAGTAAAPAPGWRLRSGSAGKPAGASRTDTLRPAHGA